MFTSYFNCDIHNNKPVTILITDEMPMRSPQCFRTSSTLRKKIRVGSFNFVTWKLFSRIGGNIWLNPLHVFGVLNKSLIFVWKVKEVIVK